MSQNSMMLITSEWGNSKTFRLFPLSNDCPFAEGIYDPEQKALVMISSKDRKETFHMLAKLDDQGDPQKLKRPRINGRIYPEERRLLETMYEHFITEKEEIQSIVEWFAVNKNFDYKSYLEKDITIPEKPNIEIVSH